MKPVTSNSDYLVVVLAILSILSMSNAFTLLFVLVDEVNLAFNAKHREPRT